MKTIKLFTTTHKRYFESSICSLMILQSALSPRHTWQMGFIWENDFSTSINNLTFRTRTIARLVFTLNNLNHLVEGFLSRYARSSYSISPAPPASARVACTSIYNRMLLTFCASRSVLLGIETNRKFVHLDLHLGWWHFAPSFHPRTCQNT